MTTYIFSDADTSYAHDTSYAYKLRIQVTHTSYAYKCLHRTSVITTQRDRLNENRNTSIRHNKNLKLDTRLAHNRV